MNDNQKNAEFKVLEQHIKQTISELEFCDQQLAELQQAKNAINTLQKNKPGDSTWVQLAHGIRIKAKIESTEDLLVHVGADTAVVKNPTQANELIQQQIDALSGYMDQLQQRLQELSTRADAINRAGVAQ